MSEPRVKKKTKERVQRIGRVEIKGRGKRQFYRNKGLAEFASLQSWGRGTAQSE
jgi:hypothetical protein